MSESREGTVLRAQSGHCAVVADDGRVWDCRVRGRLKHGPRAAQSVVVAGDRVRFLPQAARGESDPAGVVEEVLPRRNKVSRFASRRSGGRVEQVLMANLDQVVVVQSVAQPAPSAGLVDRLLVAAERYGVGGVVCLNKCDLAPALAADPRWAHYASVGYGVVRCSAVTGEGLEELQARLRERVSVLLGASGVGKSSLLNRLRPDLRLRTGEVLDKTGLGRHTTTLTELFPLPEGGGLLADSPGLRGFDPWDIAPLELRDHFPDWREPQARCRFRTCLHRDEPECGVKAAVARGEIPAWRLEAYLALLADIESRRERHAP
jgi:ribosome biogenesis GTPase